MRILGVLAMLLALAGCGAGGVAPRCGLRVAAEVPVRMVGATPLVEVRMNGVPLTLVLDTGAERTVLTEAAARRAGLVFDQRDIRRGSGTGGTVSSFAARVRRFELAGLDIPDHPVLATPHPLASVGGKAIDGLLPALVLSAYDVDLDLPGRKMTLYEGTVCGDTAIPPWREASISIPADFEAWPRILLRVRAGGAELRAMMDTGAHHISISPRAAALAGVTPAQVAAAPTVPVRGIGTAPVQAHVVRLAELTIGPERAQNVPVLVSDSGMGSLDLIVGVQYLGNRRLWLSNARRQVFIMVPPRQ